MRQKIVELKKKAKEATTPSGCSFMNLGKFIKEPKQLLDFALNILASDSRSSSVPFAVVLKHHNDPLLIISGTNQGCREISLLQQQQGMHNQLGMSSSGSQGLHMLQSEATNVGGNATIGTGGGFPDFVCIGSGKQDIGISGEGRGGNSSGHSVAMWERRLSLKLLLAALNGKDFAVAMCRFCRLTVVE
ncbi:hypothetical protein JHK85_012546 [Glycine max]|nr:hypothetical protein JHK85_012546 [Glycine max]